MNNRFITLFTVVLLLTVFTSGCVKLPQAATTLSYPETTQVSITFQDEDIPADCRVFSHRLTYTPAQSTGRQIHDRLISDAKTNGADIVVIGLVREQLKTDSEEYLSDTYGPSSPYLYQSKWSGWKYGFKDWRKQGEMINFGINSLQDSKTEYHQGLIMQNIYLTCRPRQQADKK